MARALARGLIEAEVVKAEQVVASDAMDAQLDAFALAVPGSKRARTNLELSQRADVVVLAVKPQQLESATSDLAGPTAGKLVVSILAGVRLSKLAALLPQARLARVMPNTPALVGQSASAYALGPSASEGDDTLVAALLAAVGRSYRVDEKLLDAVTGLSGSGPAFVYVAIEALADGGVRMGLPRDIAMALAAQTVKGAAEMVLTTGEHPGVLKDRVASPGGTTIAGLAALESGGLRAALMGAVEAATKRSIELGAG
jgi:pyrroline-5-carboxylate reductase